jgi:hypothetical protein
MVAVLPPTIQPDGIYDPGTTAAMLEIGPTTLWRYTRQGLITKRVRPGQKKGHYLGRDIIKLHRTLEVV